MRTSVLSQPGLGPGRTADAPVCLPTPAGQEAGRTPVPPAWSAFDLDSTVVVMEGAGSVAKNTSELSQLLGASSEAGPCWAR